MRVMNRLFSIVAGLGLAILAGGAAMAQQVKETLPIVGEPKPWGTGFQPAATEIAEDVQWLDGMVLVIITAIVLFVLALLVIVAVRYRRSVNPAPAGFTHNSVIEVTWTVVPIVILIFIGAFSLPILIKELDVPEGDVHIKITGNQWFWTYSYPDEGIEFDSLLLGKDELADYGYTPDKYLLAVDNPVVLPVGKTVVFQTAGADVIHSWAVPAFGLKLDAIPGRLNELWFTPKKEGVYFGQCSELCGKDHAYMPIEVRVVSEEAYKAWLKQAKEEFAAGNAPRKVAVASAE